MNWRLLKRNIVDPYCTHLGWITIEFYKYYLHTKITAYRPNEKNPAKSLIHCCTTGHSYAEG